MLLAMVLSDHDQSFGAHLGAFTWASDPQSASTVHQRLFIRASILRSAARPYLATTSPSAAARNNWGAGDRSVRCACRRMRACTRSGAAAAPAVLEDAIEHKFVVLRGDGTVDWEPILHNRKLVLSAMLEDVSVAATWGQPYPDPLPMSTSHQLLSPQNLSAYDRSPSAHASGVGVSGGAAGGVGGGVVVAWAVPWAVEAATAPCSPIAGSGNNSAHGGSGADSRGRTRSRARRRRGEDAGSRERIAAGRRRARCTVTRPTPSRGSPSASSSSCTIFRCC